MSTKEIEKKARALCTHTIVYTDAESKIIATRAMQGRTTREIADELGLPITTVQYRITKAQDSLGIKFRAEYRSGTSKLVREMLRRTEPMAMRIVEKEIAPQFIPFARRGVSRIAA
jgi:DNA-binding NarL/FixJ family response regulator